MEINTRYYLQRKMKNCLSYTILQNNISFMLLISKLVYVLESRYKDLE